MRTRNLAIFIVAALGIGWVGRLIDVAIDRPSTEGLGILLWLITPAIVAVLLRTFAGNGWTDAGLSPNLRGNVRWYVLALLVYPVLAAVVSASARCWVSSRSQACGGPLSPLSCRRQLSLWRRKQSRTS